MFLLDTNVVSELRRARPHGAVVAWLKSAANSDLFLSAVTIGEIQAGIEATRSRDKAKAEEIEAWLAQIAETFNVLPMGAAEFREYARLMVKRSDPISEDAMIAATARVHGLTVATRNTRDFADLSVKTINPFA